MRTHVLQQKKVLDWELILFDHLIGKKGAGRRRSDSSEHCSASSKAFGTCVRGPQAAGGAAENNTKILAGLKKQK